ncbi:MAG: hypothetical protein WBB28_02030 [Crinalium sp.]
MVDIKAKRPLTDVFVKPSYASTAVIFTSELAEQSLQVIQDFAAVRPDFFLKQINDHRFASPRFNIIEYAERYDDFEIAIAVKDALVSAGLSVTVESNAPGGVGAQEFFPV